MAEKEAKEAKRRQQLANALTQQGAKAQVMAAVSAFGMSPAGASAPPSHPPPHPPTAAPAAKSANASAPAAPPSAAARSAAAPSAAAPSAAPSAAARSAAVPSAAALPAEPDVPAPVPVALPGPSSAPRAQSFEAMEAARREEQASLVVSSLDNMGGALSTLHIESVATTFKVTKVRASVEFSNLVQGTLGWVAGCAWSDFASALFPSMNAPPSFPVLIANTCVALSVSGLAILWLIVSGDDPTTVPWDEVLDREGVEQYFVTGAASFFVGWAWVLVIRDLFVPFGHAVGTVVDWMLIGVLQLSIPQSAIFFTSEFLSVCIFVPLLTYGFFVTKHLTRRGYRRAVGLRSKRRWLMTAKGSASLSGNDGLLAFLERSKMQMVVKRAAAQTGLATTALLSEQDDRSA